MTVKVDKWGFVVSIEFDKEKKSDAPAPEPVEVQE